MRRRKWGVGFSPHIHKKLFKKENGKKKHIASNMHQPTAKNKKQLSSNKQEQQIRKSELRQEQHSSNGSSKGKKDASNIQQAMLQLVDEMDLRGLFDWTDDINEKAMLSWRAFVDKCPDLESTLWACSIKSNTRSCAWLTNTFRAPQWKQQNQDSRFIRLNSTRLADEQTGNGKHHITSSRKAASSMQQQEGSKQQQ